MKKAFNLRRTKQPKKKTESRGQEEQAANDRMAANRQWSGGSVRFIALLAPGQLNNYYRDLVGLSNAWYSPPCHPLCPGHDGSRSVKCSRSCSVVRFAG